MRPAVLVALALSVAAALAGVQLYVWYLFDVPVRSTSYWFRLPEHFIINARCIGFCWHLYCRFRDSVYNDEEWLGHHRAVTVSGLLLLWITISIPFLLMRFSSTGVAMALDTPVIVPLLLSACVVNAMRSYLKTRVNNKRTPTVTGSDVDLADNDDDNESAPVPAAEQALALLRCIVCRANRRCVVYAPCGHLSSCFACEQHRHMARGACPICRGAVLCASRLHVS